MGGIGSCGRELCCSTWLNDFKSVSTTAARYQNLSINQTKLSGQCGRLKCCLNYELDTYMDALRVFPDHADKIKTTQGTAWLQKRDIFKNLMWYSFEKSNTLYPLTIERVNEILELNKKGVFPEELQAVEVTKKTAISEKTDFVDVVGQFSLKGLERASKKKKQKNKNQQANSGSKQGQEANATDKSATPRPKPNPPKNKPKPNAPQGNKSNPGQPGQKPNSPQGQTGQSPKPKPNPSQQGANQGQGKPKPQHKPRPPQTPKSDNPKPTE